LDNTFRWDMYARYEYTLQHSDPIPGRRILDVGCGTGRYALEYARRGAGHVTGIDIAGQMITICEQRSAAENLDSRCEFLVTDLLEYKPVGNFDVAIGIGLFDYIRDALPVVAAMRVAVQDRAIMSFPRLWTWRAPVRKARLALRNCPVYFYSKSRLDKLIRDAGFVRYDLEQIGQLYCVTAFVK
jgi:cyclopropane fatty-acyl-phospholipid synthase-like methyltransferase